MNSKSLPNIILSIILLYLVSTSCSDSSYRKCEGAIWATTYHITYKSNRVLDDSILSVLQRVEMSLSPFADNSLVTRINNNATDETDSLFRRIFSASQQISAQSRGAFDPTVAPLVNLWGFGYRNTGTEPDEASIDSALALVGILECHIDDSGCLHKRASHTEFNFSAITKGYACDLVGEMLKRNGCNDYMVEIGGEVAISGVNPRGDKWRIMIDAPIESDTAVVHKRMAVIEISDCGVATSGNYRNFRTSAKGKSWHTISPSTGRPAETATLSVTIIAPNTMLADAYATACMAMPTDSATKFISAIPDVEALLVTTDSAGYVMLPTPGFPAIAN